MYLSAAGCLPCPCPCAFLESYHVQSCPLKAWSDVALPRCQNRNVGKFQRQVAGQPPGTTEPSTVWVGGWVFELHNVSALEGNRSICHTDECCSDPGHSFKLSVCLSALQLEASQCPAEGNTGRPPRLHLQGVCASLAQPDCETGLSCARHLLPCVPQFVPDGPGDGPCSAYASADKFIIAQPIACISAGVGTTCPANSSLLYCCSSHRLALGRLHIAHL